jgi:hypothetical protein
MGSLSFLLIAGLVALATGCRDAASAPAPRPIPNDSGVLNDATIVRDAYVRDATQVTSDANVARDAGPKGPL